MIYRPWWSYHFANGKEILLSSKGSSEYRSYDIALKNAKQDKMQRRLGDEWEIIISRHDHWEY